MTECIAIEEAGSADLDAVLGLYAQPDFDGAAIDRLAAEAIWQRMQRYPDYRLYVARIAGRVVGTFAMLIMDNIGHRGTPSAVVEDVAVAPAMQCQGVGRAMMDFARSTARAKGCYKLVLSSNLRRERAHRFYDSLGFERHGFSFRLAP